MDVRISPASAYKVLPTLFKRAGYNPRHEDLADVDEGDEFAMDTDAELLIRRQPEQSEGEEDYDEGGEIPPWTFE